MKLYYDLHMHSALSPCGDDDMTPSNMAGMAAICGLEVIALSDHNTCRNCAAFLHHAEENGLLGIPAMELTTVEEVHVLCLLPDLASALEWSDYVYARLPDIKNRADIFGAQIFYDIDDKQIGTEERLLLSATDIGIYDVAELLRGYGGIAVPAHVDRDSFSLLSNLGMYDPLMGFNVVEVTRRAPAELLPGVPKITDSDAHRLESIADAEFCIETCGKTPKAVIDALRKL